MPRGRRHLVRGVPPRGVTCDGRIPLRLGRRFRGHVERLPRRDRCVAVVAHVRFGRRLAADRGGRDASAPHGGGAGRQRPPARQRVPRRTHVALRSVRTPSTEDPHVVRRPWRASATRTRTSGCLTGTSSRRSSTQRRPTPGAGASNATSHMHDATAVEPRAHHGWSRGDGRARHGDPDGAAAIRPFPTGTSIRTPCCRSRPSIARCRRPPTWTRRTRRRRRSGCSCGGCRT